MADIETHDEAAEHEVIAAELVACTLGQRRRPELVYGREPLSLRYGSSAPSCTAASSRSASSANCSADLRRKCRTYR